MSFEVDKFMQNPSPDWIKEAKKNDLLELGKKLELEVKPSMRKQAILNEIVQYYIDEEVFPEEAATLVKPVSSDYYQELELRKLQLQEAQEKRQFEKEQLQFEKEQLLFEKEKEERRLQAENEKEERRLQHEKEQEERKIEERKQQREHDLKMAELEIQKAQQGIVNPSRSLPQSDTFDVVRHIKMVPPFQESKIDHYFTHFEKVAENLKWPKEHWTILLQSVFTGKAREIYNQLSVTQCLDYDFVKSAILKGHELVPEAYRQKFRNLRIESGQTHVEFGRQKEQLFDQWCNSMKIDENFGNLRQLVLVEEFKRGVRPDIKSFLEEKQATTLQEASTLADSYALTHKSSFTQKSHFSKFQNKSSVKTSDDSSSDSKASSEKKPSSEKQNYDSLPTVTCKYCKKPGHIVSECFKLKRRQQEESKPTGFTKKEFISPKIIDNQFDVKKSSDSVMEVFDPFITNGFVSLSSDFNSPSAPVRILRDTGSAQSLILADILPFSDKTSTQDNVLIQGVESGFISVPLHNVYLKSDLVSGLFTVGVRPSLPFKGVHFLLGNDLAGDKVVPCPIVTDTPLVNQEPETLEEKNLYPACAVTRSMAKKAIQNDADMDFNLADTFIGQSFQQDLSEKSPDSSLSGHSSDILSQRQLIKEQQNAPDLAHLYPQAVSEQEANQVPVCYYFKNDVLMRKFRPPDVPADEEWMITHQIVLPDCYRQQCLSIAHDHPMSGHLGVKKTLQRVMNHFYWPSIRSDVQDYCRSCHTCQMVGKPNQNIPRASLKPIPAFEEPFSRIIIDCVGPLPKTRSGNEYLLTIMCASTRFPEAIPLRNIKAKTIIKALTKFFCTVGLPKSIQFDQGSNFMSGIFQQVMHELGIHQYRSSAYHPESQGALERFHQTLKNMMRTYCLDTAKDWDEGVHLLLFAVRESVQESLGFSPFELVFGHTVRGPLKLLKEKFLSDEDDSMSLLQYVSDFRERLSKACDFAKSNLKESQGKMKARYDLQSKDRSFKPGDKVLALLPTPGNPLKARYFGPYTVLKKLSELNYIILTPGWRKQKQMCHINMLKEYVSRDQGTIVSMVGTDPESSTSNTDQDNDCQLAIADTGQLKLDNSDILQNIESKLSHLESSQQLQLKELIFEFRHIFPDVPSRTDMVYHDVILQDSAIPVKQHAYRMNPEKQVYLKQEVQYLLDNDFVEPSSSDWSSPCILVPKPNQTYRMVTDYRKVNTMTKTDSFPIPTIDDCIDKVGQAKFVTKFDLLKGFWQIPLTERAKEISAFVTPDGLYQYKVMPFGMKNSPATFQRLVNKVISGLPNCEAYIDDIVITSDSFNQHLAYIRDFFQRVSDAKLTINLVKSDFCRATVVYLGHVVGQGQVKPIDAKVKCIIDFPEPTNRRQLMRFLGMAGYYRKFCKNFSMISEPLTNLLKKNVKFVWCENCQNSFDQLKAILQNSPILLSPNFRQEFKLAVDASDIGAGAVLLQEDNDGVDHPVCYFSRKFNKHQRNYSTIEKECLALVLAIQHLEVYICCSVAPIQVFSDHNPLTFLHKIKNKNQRLLRWSLLLQEFDLNISHIKGKDNVIPDALSRSY